MKTGHILVSLMFVLLFATPGLAQTFEFSGRTTMSMTPFKGTFTYDSAKMGGKYVKITLLFFIEGGQVDPISISRDLSWREDGGGWSDLNRYYELNLEFPATSTPEVLRVEDLAVFPAVRFDTREDTSGRAFTGLVHREAIHSATPQVKTVQIDIRPGSDRNPINLRSKGVVPVAVLSTGDFDARMVDPYSVLLADAAPVRWRIEDVDRDGDLDMLFHFKTQELFLTPDSTEAVLKGKTVDGVEIEGKDAVTIVPKKRGRGRGKGKD
jgi:hypothetical protein